MNRDRYVRAALGCLIALGGVGIVVATATDRDPYVSGLAAAVCALSVVSVVYTNRVESR